MHKRKLIFIIIIGLILTVIKLPIVFAETVILKSGQRVKGVIIDKTDEYIRMDVSGDIFTYKINEVERIGEPPSEQEFEKRLNEAIFYFKNKKYESVIVKLNMLIELYPNDPDLYRFLGTTYYCLNDFKEAINSFNKAFSLDPEEEIDCLSLWAIYEVMGEPNNAKQSLLIAIDNLRKKEKFPTLIIADTLFKKLYGK
jgi:tetratricopeptide (TPR) repeat protein